jgi:hypothetical protein
VTSFPKDFLWGSATAARERRIVLLDSPAIDELHRRVWELPSDERARAWGRPGRTP